MGWFESIFLGLVQGLTEFLPVSSSGHLSILQYFLGVKEAGITFEIFLHVATLFAVFFCYWQEIWGIIKKPFQKFTALIIVGCIPAGLVGVLFDDYISAMFSSIWVPIALLLLTATFLILSDRIKGTIKTTREMTYGDALFIGMFQCFAILPGLSRSGSTMFGALLRGVAREEAAKFSFIMSIPVILGAGLLEFVDAVQVGGFEMTMSIMAGGIVAALSGVFAIRLFVNLLKKAKLSRFAMYCVALSVISALLVLLGF